MIQDRVLPIQLALLLVAIPLVHGVLANGYTIQHEEQDSYYDRESHSRHSSSDENNIEDDHKSGGYSYQYQVHSPHTGDYKTQHEERIGDVVRGSYSLIDPDGMKRIVEYTADPVHGFKAVVKREPTNMHLQHQPESQPEPQPQPELQPQIQQHYQHLSPQLIQPKPITKPPLVPRPTPPTKPSYPMRIKYPVNLFHTTHQPIPVYYETTSVPAHKVRNTPHSKYSFFRFHGWPFVY